MIFDVVHMSYAEGLQVLITEAGARLYCFNREAIEHAAVLAELAASDHRPGTREELEELDSQEPELKERFNIIAIGETAEDSSGGARYVAAILRGDFVLLPPQGRVGRGWKKQDRFLAFHK